MNILKFKKGQKVWLIDSEGIFHKETIVGFAENIQEYELSDGNFYEEKEIYPTKKLAELDN